MTARLSDRLSMAHDASHYLLTPEAVVTPLAWKTQGESDASPRFPGPGGRVRR